MRMNLKELKEKMVTSFSILNPKSIDEQNQYFYFKPNGVSRIDIIGLNFDCISKVTVNIEYTKKESTSEFILSVERLSFLLSLQKNDEDVIDIKLGSANHTLIVGKVKVKVKKINLPFPVIESRNKLDGVVSLTTEETAQFKAMIKQIVFSQDTSIMSSNVAYITLEIASDFIELRANYSNKILTSFKLQKENDFKGVYVLSNNFEKIISKNKDEILSFNIFKDKIELVFNNEKYFSKLLTIKPLSTFDKIYKQTFPLDTVDFKLSNLVAELKSLRKISLEKTGRILLDFDLLLAKTSGNDMSIETSLAEVEGMKKIEDFVIRFNIDILTRMTKIIKGFDSDGELGFNQGTSTILAYRNENCTCMIACMR